MAIICADILDWCRDYDGPPFHALLCDPPYHLYSRRTAGEADQSDTPGGRFNPGRGGFMGKEWDGGDVAYRAETWAALAEHLYPGAFGMAFASSRGWHRLACAIEDAGMVIHPSIFLWVYGSGFPKASRAGEHYRGDDGKIHLAEDPRFTGHRYGLQALKPAAEPVIVFQKPYRGKPVACITETGAGALWVDGGRIGTAADMNPNDFDDSRRTAPKFSGTYNGGKDGQYRAGPGAIPNGRWPANFALCHLPECRRVGEKRVSGASRADRTRECGGGCGVVLAGSVDGTLNCVQSPGYASPDGTETVESWDCAPGCPVAALDEQAGVKPASARPNCVGKTYDCNGQVFQFGERQHCSLHADTGPASRFFFRADWNLEQGDPVLYCPKAARSERDAGLEGALAGCAQRYGSIRANRGAGYDEGSRARNPHPTVKPLALCRWLATLLLPPVEYAPRRILVPFAGTASEMIGAHQAGWEEVTGIEREAEYVTIAEARWAHWMAKPEQERMEL